MYLSFYGLAEKPFSQTPDPKFLYWNDAYRETIASLRYGIQERKGFVTMIGEAGTGKTTLLRKLLDDLGPEVVSVFLFNPNASFEEILEYTLSELGIPAASGRKLAMMQRLNDFLLAAFQEGRNTILLIDEAQDLETDVLESLRLLSNLETAKDKILQIVLSGQPELATRLAQPNLRQLKQRIAVRCRIEPLGRHELSDYIAARLAVVGGRPDLFAPPTLDPIWEFARGIPRLINTVCDNALLVGYALGRQTIDAEVIAEVAADLGKIDVPVLPEIISSEASASVAVPAAAALAPTITEPVLAAPEPPRAAPEPAALLEPRTAAAAAQPAPKPVATTSDGNQDHHPAPRRRTAALVVGLVLGGAIAWGALRWQDVRPRLQGVPGDSRLAKSEVPPPDARRDAPPILVPPVRATTVADHADAMVLSDQQTSTPEVMPSPTAGEVVVPAPAAAVGDEPDRPQSAAATPERVADEAPATGSASDLIAKPQVPAKGVAATPVVAAVTQDLQPKRIATRATKRVRVQRGDTLMNLAARQYGFATYTILDIVRQANPDIQDVDKIITGSEILFPDPGASSRLVGEGATLSVLIATTPVLLQAQEIQRLVDSRYQIKADVEPVGLGDGHSLYRVSLHRVPDQSQALQLAESLGSIVRDPS